MNDCINFSNQYKPLLTDEMQKIEGGGGCGDALLGLLGGLGKAPTADQLNGGATRNFRAHNCGPYGQGGTPNSCNF